MCKLGPEKLMTSKMIYSYLWQQLTINVEELHQSAVIDKGNVITSYFVEIEYLKQLIYYREYSESFQPSMCWDGLGDIGLHRLWFQRFRRLPQRTHQQRSTVGSSHA
jgi:hypothetical protein